MDTNRIIIYSSSTATTVNNKVLLSNIRDCTEDETLLIHTNGGDTIFHQQGDLNIVPITAHYDPMSLAKILATKDVQNISGIRITVDTLEESSIIIHLYDGNVLKLQECNDGLYYYTMAHGADSKKTKSKSSVTNYYPNPLSKFSATVKEKKEFFTKRDIERANAARKL